MAERGLRPDKLSLEASDPESQKIWTHWKRMFTAYLTSIDTPTKPINKLDHLISSISHNLFELIEESSDYEAAIKVLDRTFNKEINLLFARHILLTRKQKDGESIQEYVNALRNLSKPCKFTPVDANQCKEEYIRDSFVSGLLNNDTKRKILESSKTKLEEIITLAQIYEDAKNNASSFGAAPNVTCSVISEETSNEENTSASMRRYPSKTPSCGWCGHDRHPKAKCPARDSECGKCGAIGHWARVCRSKTNINTKKAASASVYPVLASISKIPECLLPSTTTVGLKGKDVRALWDTGSAENYIDRETAKQFQLEIFPESGEVAMANTSQHTKTAGFVRVKLTVNGKTYPNTKLTLLPHACVPIILGISFLNQHQEITIKYAGNKPPIITALGTLTVDPPSLFDNLTADCHPIATKSRRYCASDRAFIRSEVDRLLKEGIIEKSNSPWRAQPFVTGGGNQKKRLVIDYSETINRFTLLDAYPLPRIDDMINQIAQYGVYSTIDMRSAYHQVPIKEEDKPYTAFEADGGLYQFCRLPFGVTNGVSCFQREMDRFVEKNSLKGVFPYMDNITICGKDQKNHDENLSAFLEAAKDMNLTYNEEKCEFSTTKLHLLGSLLENGTIKPDPNRLTPLLELTPPTDMKSLKRILGFFSYYSKWIKNFSKKISLLVKANSFPLNAKELESFENLKHDVADSVVAAIDESVPFTVECDASHSALAGTLNQSGRPVAFFSRTLRGSEILHSSVEKEAQAIVESIRYWRHFLTGRHFTLVTDQKSVSFMFNTKHKGKIKNEKIMRWRMELIGYNFDIMYKPGPENIPPDTFSRGCASISPTSNKLKCLHDDLSHPGVTRMAHFIKTRNLPYSLDEVRKINNCCRDCAEIKPRYFKPEPAHLIKATQPFERLNLDFKGPLPSNNKNKYFLHVVDEFSRFPWVFPCSDLTSSTIIKCLCTLFSMFGMPAYVHSDRGSSFMSRELRQFLNSRGISCSRTTPYNPEGNGQVEKGNHTIWRSILLSLSSKKLPNSHWQEVLPDVLHSVRTLLCTATNCTPHERMFQFQRRSGTGTSLPTWLLVPGPVLLRRFVRRSKQEPLVDEVQLIEANPQYAFIRYPDGRESTVSIKDLAPTGEVRELSEEVPDAPQVMNLDGEHGEATPVEDVMPTTPIASPETKILPFEAPSELPSSTHVNKEISNEASKAPEVQDKGLVPATRRHSTRIIKPTKRLIAEV